MKQLPLIYVVTIFNVFSGLKNNLAGDFHSIDAMITRMYDFILKEDSCLNQHFGMFSVPTKNCIREKHVMTVEQMLHNIWPDVHVLKTLLSAATYF